MYLWGRRMWQPRPISYQVQDPRRGRRNVQGWAKNVQAARRRCQGQPCPRRTEITEGESGTLSRTASPGILNKKTNIVGQQWGRGGGAIPGEAVTSTLNAHSRQSGRINEEMTPEQYHLVCCNSQQVKEGGRWDRHSSITLFAATHSKLKKVADGIGTQVATCMINKWMAKINGNKIYNIRAPPRTRAEKGRWSQFLPFTKASVTKH